MDAWDSLGTAQGSGLDGTVHSSALDRLTADVDTILRDDHADHLVGWYVADEPRNTNSEKPYSYTPAQVQDVIDAIRQGESDAGEDSLKTYLVDRSYEFEQGSGNPCCWNPVANYNYNTNVLMLPWYEYYDYDDSTQGTDYIRSLAFLNDIIINARKDQVEDNRNWELHIVLNLGEEREETAEYDSVHIQSHGMTHAAIRKAYDLGVDGIWFYAWRVESTFEDDAFDNWNTGLNYAQPVEDEIHDYDKLFIAYANSSKTYNKLYLNDLSDEDSPFDEFIQDDSVSYVVALASGDLMGEEGDDTYYLDGKDGNTPTAYNRNTKPNGDGDDELVSAFLFSETSKFYIDGDAQDPQNNSTSVDSVLAVTIGDFDGDGDGEIATAVQVGDSCKIYYSDDGTDIYEHKVYSGTYWHVTAMVAGDFDGRGRDRLVTAFTNSDSTHTAIYLSDPMWGQSPAAGSIYNSSTDGFYVSALAAGDFDSDVVDFDEVLVTAFATPEHDSTIISLITPDTDSTGEVIDSTNHIYNGSYYHVTAMAAGDFTGARVDSLVTAFWNQTYNETVITVCTPSTGGGSGNPGHGSNYIYHSGSSPEFHVTAMTAGSFTESLGDPENHSWKSAIASSSADRLPDKFTLEQNYPNPFNPSTTISFQLPIESRVLLTIYDLRGRRVAELINKELKAGLHNIIWNGKNSFGQMQSSGMYFYRVVVGKQSFTSKMLLLK